jgi:hypothetical protein
MADSVINTIPECPEWLLGELNKFFKNQELAEAAAAETNQDRIAKFMQTGRKSIDGLGRPVMELDEYVLAHWRKRLGYNPLKDSGWRAYMMKHFPAVRVDAIGTKEIHVGYGSMGFGVKKRFSKKY